MKCLITITFILLTFFITFNINAQAPTAAWINEFHYDNTGADTLEFIEIVVNESFTDLSNFTVTFYNGSDSMSYDSETLDNFTEGSIQDGFKIYSALIAGIQNGSPDGIAIDYNGNLIAGQFLSYEGTITASGGPAHGITSTDIGVSQSSSTPIGSSLGLTGNGTQYSDFTWTSFVNATIGTANGSQTLPVELSSFSASFLENAVMLNWRTETEVNNHGFEVQRSEFGVQGSEFRVLGFVEGHGNTNSPKEYSFTDDLSLTHNLNHTLCYRLKQIDTDGKFEYSKIVEVDLETPLSFELEQNYPNPFNPSTTINFSLPENSFVNLSVFNVLGEKVATLLNENKDAGIHSINFNAEELNSGIYFYKLETSNFTQIKKMMLVK